MTSTKKPNHLLSATQSLPQQDHSDGHINHTKKAAQARRSKKIEAALSKSKKQRADALGPRVDFPARVDLEVGTLRKFFMALKPNEFNAMLNSRLRDILVDELLKIKRRKKMSDEAFKAVLEVQTDPGDLDEISLQIKQKLGI